MYKIVLALLIPMALFGEAQAEKVRLSEPVQHDEASETFGAAIGELPTVMTLTDILVSPQRFIGKTFAVDTSVQQVCQKKGCFFIAQEGAQTIRVSFKDYAFFVPTDIAGRKVVLVGELVANELSKKQAEHLSSDLGEQGSVSSGSEYQIIASSVRVMKPR